MNLWSPAAGLGIIPSVENGAQQAAGPEISPRVEERQVVLVGFDGLQALDLVGPLEVFTKANQHAPDVGHAPFRYAVTVASVGGGEMLAGSGLCIARTIAIDDLPTDLDTVLIGGGSEEGIRDAGGSGRLTEWLRERAPRVRRMGSVCTGAFLLGAAGLLDGRRATTHWRSCELLKAMFPAIEIVPDAI